MQMPEDSASLGQQQEGGLLGGEFSVGKSQSAHFSSSLRNLGLIAKLFAL